MNVDFSEKGKVIPVLNKVECYEDVSYT